ncbi:MAG: T9SS type A sorting domain-containing protein [Candidatus Eisenbacteria bacterium]|uniref:T9SS type A sorting domain-containing protein n=1 Tax=Eiseniibacteriota bacterium TaxID=2212470 RepID=A0A538UBQ9_UNCEI|nr:MAG: T9SS type A sorting domain-containing protein [Candidatus Eisenbacteria bacterium]
MLLIAHLAAAGTAQLSGSGTISSLSPSLTYAGGTYVASNPTPPASSAGGVTLSPVCTDNTCDRFLLTVANIPDAYHALHPDDRLVFKTEWTNSGSDFDLWVYDSTGNTVLTKSASSADPEIATLPILAGTTRYVVRVVPFTVTGDSFTGTIGLGSLPGPPPVYHAADYAAGTDVFSCNLHLTGTDQNGSDHGRDKEPAVRFNPDGVGYVASNGDGVGLWRVTDACGQEDSFLGIADLSNGGGDCDVETGTARNANGFYNLYTSALHSADALVNINASVSFDNGQTFLTTPITNATPLNDRNWSAAYGKDIVYLSYRSANTGNQQFVVRAQAVEGQPLVFGPSAPVYTDPTVLQSPLPETGNMVVDPRPVPLGTPAMTAGIDGQGDVYHGFIVNGGQSAYVAVSRDFGVTWKDTKVFDAPPGSTYSHIFSWVAVDRAGNVYTCFADDHAVYYSVSTDLKTSDTPTWSRPVRVSDGPDTKSSALPSVAAGSSGRIVFIWYGSPTASVTDTDAQWRVFFSRCDNALDALALGGVPHIEQTVVSDHVVHEGELCEGGTLGCSGNTRALLDDIEVDVDPLDGSALLAFTDDGPIGGTFITRQLSGGSSIAGEVVTDRSQACPVVAENCSGTPEPPGSTCFLPGFRVFDDASGDMVGNFASPESDILRGFVAEPLRPDMVQKITFTLKVASLDPANLPLNRIWQMDFTVPTSPETTFFVAMQTCNPTKIPNFTFGFVNAGANNINTGLGTADAGEVLADGEIRITMPKGKVGSSTSAGSVYWHADIGSRLRAVKGQSFFLEGADCSGLLDTVDETGSGSYTVQGNCTPVGVEPTGAGGPMLALAGGNPVRGQTRLTYALPRAGHVRIAVFNVAGQRVCTLADREQEGGLHAVDFDLERSAGHRLGPGVYLVRLEAGNVRRQVRIIALR